MFLQNLLRYHTIDFQKKNFRKHKQLAHTRFQAENKFKSNTVHQTANRLPHNAAQRWTIDFIRMRCFF